MDENGAPLTASPEVPLREIPPDAGRDFHPDDRYYRVEPGWIQLGRLGGVLGALVTLLILLVPAIFAAVSWLPEPYARLALPAWGLLALFLLVRAFVWPALAYRGYLFRLDERRLQIRSGVIGRQLLDIPRNRIQHTDVGHGVLERAFGLTHLVVHTAGTENASVRLSGLREEIAIRLRDELLATRSDDAV